MTWKGYFEDMPDVCHLNDSTVADGDKWLSTFVPKIINSGAYGKDTLADAPDNCQEHNVLARIIG